MKKEHEGEKEESFLTSEKLFFGFMFAAFLALAFTQLQISRASGMVAGIALLQDISPQSSGQAVSASAQASSPASSGATSGSIDLKALEKEVFPTGTPEIYGDELGVSYDNPVPAIKIFASFDDGKPMADSKLNQRYVGIASLTSCEYCCGAKALIFPNGQAACGCAHSFAMRGLAKYLVEKHPDMSDEQILSEITKWKALYFPKQSMQKAVQFKLAGKEINPIDLSSNKFRGFKADTGSAAGGLDAYSGQVGGC